MTRSVREILHELQSHCFICDGWSCEDCCRSIAEETERDLRTAIAEELEGEKVIIDSNNRRVKWESYNDAISACQSHIVNGGKVNVKDKEG